MWIRVSGGYAVACSNPISARIGAFAGRHSLHITQELWKIESSTVSRVVLPSISSSPTGCANPLLKPVYITREIDRRRTLRS